LKTLFFTVLILIFGYLFCFAQAPSFAPTDVVIHREKAGNLDARGWCEAKSSRGGFVVLLPGLFNDFSIIASDPKGVSVPVHVVATFFEDGAVQYAASCAESAPGVKLGKGSLDELIEKTRTIQTVSNALSINYQGYPGVEFQVSSKKGNGIVRAYVIGNKLYQLVVDFGFGKAKIPKEDMQTFFASFKVLE